MDKILLLNLGGLGDLILSAPALSALRARFPSARIDLLTAAKNAGVMARYGTLDAEHLLDLSRGGLAALPALAPALATLFRLRLRRYDALLNMRTLYTDAGAAKVKWLCRAIGARIAAGRDTDGRGAFFDRSVRESTHGVRHESEYDRDLVALFGATDAPGFSFPISDAGHGAATAFLREQGLPPGGFCAWHAGGMPSRRYPAELVARAMELVRRDRPKIRFVVTGSSSERGEFEALRSLGKSVLDATGALDLDALAALFRHAGAVVANDTGPLHVAAALRLAPVALFGPGDFPRFDPRHVDPASTALRGRAPCAPCERRSCASRACLRGIPPEAVARAILRRLERIRAAD